MDLNLPFSFQSDEEMYFYWYLEELKDHGYISGYKYQPKPFLLSEPVYHSWLKQLKTKQKQCKSTLLQSHEYQADFLVHWKRNAHFIFHISLADPVKIDTPFISNISKSGHYYSVIDVKGTYNQQDNIRRFSISQKWIWNRYKIFVQKIVPVPKTSKEGKLIPAEALFLSTFTPRRYLLTDKNMTSRKIRFPNRSIQNFISIR